MEDRLNKELHTVLPQTRENLAMNKSAMAQRYHMAKNTYCELENKSDHGFGLLKAILLLHDQEDPKKVLDDLYEKMNQTLGEVTVLI